MAALTKKPILLATVATLGVSALAYWMFAANAVQGRGVLAQAPLNLTASVTPAFMMAVDDSGSMSFETNFPGRDGQGCFSSGSFFSAPRVLRTTGTCSFHHLIPHRGTRYRIDANRLAIPPLDAFGFARSPTYNPQYFDPNGTYGPWMNQDGVAYPDASPTAARVDPRDAITLNLVADREVSGDADDYFRVLNGMVIPANVRYYKTGTCNGLAGNTNQWESRNSDQTITSATCNVGFRFYPATFYLPEAAAMPAGYRAANRVLVNGACGTGCNLYKYEIRSANYTSTGAYDAAAQSFANWFTYYGNRNRSMISGMTRSLLDINNMRIGYLRINQNASFDSPLTNTGERVTMRDMGVTAQRSALYADLLSLPASGGTPNRQAVFAASSQFARTDAGAPVQLACQKNAVMLFTDGFSNTDGPTVGNRDGAMGAPFSDMHFNTLADIATSFYLNTNDSLGMGGASPLRTDFARGKVPVPTECNTANPDPRLDCQSNLHVNFYGITLGAKGDLYDPTLTQDPYTDGAIFNNWPSRQNDNPSTVDDIWHASINTRGEYINARSPVDITEAMRRILASVGGGVTPSGTIGLTGARVGVGSLAVEPRYSSTNNGTDWYSTLTASQITANPVTGSITESTRWEAASRLTGTSGSRRIFVGKSSGSVVPTVVPFQGANVTLNELCNGTAQSRCTGAGVGRTSITGGLGINVDQAVAYLRGDQQLESSTTTPLRIRTTVLGDIVNSSPVVNSPFNDFGYRALRGDTPTAVDPFGYAAYLELKKTRPAMVYVGANDGMLHAFRGDTGAEQFAYIPVPALGHMGNLLFPYRVADKNDQVFQHRYYVDGPLVVSDAYINGNWKTTLTGSLGAGGKGAFGLDVSTPSGFGPGQVLFDINDKASVARIRDNIGHVLGRPVIVPVKVGTQVRWKALFGNGYNSTNGRAVLFIVDLSDPAGANGIVTVEATEATQPQANGLGNIIALDRFAGSTTTAGRDGYADTVYGADQNGAVWKFDLRATTPSALTTPFFVATDPSGERQAITGGLEAAAGPRGGVMVYFGTGSFSFVNDAADRQVQSFYAVLDTGTAVARSDLQAQTMTSDVAGDRITSMLPLATNAKGWYINLQVGNTATGERMVATPRVQGGIIFFPTFDPNTTDSCATGGTNRLYGLSALNGAAALSAVRLGSPTGSAYGDSTGGVKLSTTGSAPVTDVALFTTPRQAPLPPPPPGTPPGTPPPPPPDVGCSMVVRAPGSEALYLRRPCGRQSWRQVR